MTQEDRERHLTTIRDGFQELIPQMILLHERVAKDTGLNGVELQVLHLLSLADRPLSPSELSDRTELPRSTMTRAIAALERAGFVGRETVPEDGRRFLVHPVPETTAAVSARFDRYARAMDAAGQLFSGAELATIARYWDALRTEVLGDEHPLD